MTRRNIVVVSAGLSQPSSSRLLGDRLGAATRRALERDGSAADIEVVELREHAQDLTNHLLTGFPSGRLRAAIEAVRTADGLVVVTPVFNASFSGLFKMFFDVLERGSLTGKPVLLGATGGSARHSLALEHALRPLFTHLQAVTVPTAVFAASEDWGSNGGTHGALTARIDRAGEQLARFVELQETPEPVDPFEAPTPFEQLLAGHS